MPLFVYNDIPDATTTIGPTDDHIERICRVGANVLYQRNTAGSHDDEYVTGGVRALKWLGQALDGKPLEPAVGCKWETVTIAV